MGGATRWDNAARQEFLHAIVWYRREAGLACGRRFVAAVSATVGMLQRKVVPLVAMPSVPSGLGAKYLAVYGFPYKVVVVPEADGYCVIALAHVAREPGYWRKRDIVDMG